MHAPEGVPGVASASHEEASLESRYTEVRALTEVLAAPLSPEDQTVQSIPDVSPTKWHRGHTTWFFETFVLDEALPGYQPFHPRYGYLFNSYYESAGDRYPRAKRGLVSRPGVKEVKDYRIHVDELMSSLLDDVPDPASAFVVELGIHHEQQHQELILMDIKHVLSMSPLDPPYMALSRGLPPLGKSASQPRASVWIGHEGGRVRIGHEGEGFAFDNERPAHEVLLLPFEIADRPVTCGEWLAFMGDDGYLRPELWLSEGWAARQAEGWEAPLYWEADHDGASPNGWTIFTLGGRRPVEESEPVCHVSYYEADAFARWAGARLPTEFEWEAIASFMPLHGRFLDSSLLSEFHPAPPETHGSHGAGSHDRAPFFNDVWVWTSSAYLPYPRFSPWRGGLGEYNGKFMVNQQVLRGGCCVTPAGHMRPTYRNFFPPNARWAFSGLRLARDA